MIDYRTIMNEPIMWALCIPAVSMTVVQALLFTKRAKSVGEYVGLSREEANKAFKVGMVSSIGPALSSAVVMITLISAIGGAFSWLRLSFIGSATTEFMAARIGASAAGVELGGAGYELMAYSASVWAMTINAFGWLTFVALFTPKLDQIRQKLVGDDNQLMGVVAASALVGSMSYMFIAESTKGHKQAAVGFSCAILMFALIKVATKFPVIREHLLTIVLLFGMTLGATLTVIMK